jgi:TAT (twin-arginine translocation) pathway signal sequence
MKNPIKRRQISRRDFVKTLGAGAAAMSLPLILHADDKAGGKAPILGSGGHTYEAVHGWAQVPEGMRFGNTHMVQEDAQGRILIHHQKGAPDSVFVFDPDGKFIKSWGAEFRTGAHGMQLRKEGGQEFLYLATTGQRTVVKTTIDGEVVFTLTYPKDAENAASERCYKDEQKYIPTNIAFAPNGDFYVADGYGSYYVHRYDIKGNYISTFGGKGTDDGALREPHGIWCDTRGSEPRILVADRMNERLQWFTLDGAHYETLDGQDKAFRRPCHFDQRNGELLVPGLDGRVSILDKNNKQIAILGDNDNPDLRGKNDIGPERRKPGVFVSPHGCMWDRAGNIYITEWVADGRVTKLRKVDA